MSSGTPLVSIITPSYNAERFLAEAVESVLNQSYRCWQLLLVDDGSSDSSVLIARSYAEQHPDRILLLAHPNRENRGLPATRNLGLRSCAGELVALLDADDVWLPRKLEEQVGILRDFPEAGMVFGRSEYWYGPDSSENHVPELAPGERLYAPPDLLTLCYPLGRFGAPCPTDLLIRKSLLEELGGFEESFDDRAPTHEDIAVLSKIFLSSPVYVSNQCWDRYRRHPESIWAKAQLDGSDARSREFYFSWLGAYMRRTGVTDPQVWALYRKHCWPYRHRRLAGALRFARALMRPVKRLYSRASSA